MKAESYTVEEVKRRVLSKSVSIRVSSERVEDGRDSFGKIQFKAVPTIVTVANERDMKSELVLSGPKQQGEVKVYIGTDARKHYFDAKTGEALGSVLGPEGKKREQFIKPILPPKSEPTPMGTDRRWIR